ncbi:S9 family peptidase [Paenibacillus kandeliae]|uniref:S9 family peptidase n=1 Tax=Paenibacillus kandeliae TaxID=3231269 RepID=UPI003458E8DE
MSKQQKVQAEDLYRFQWIQEPVADPTGQRIVYVSRQVNEKRTGYDMHLRIINTDGSGDRPFTSGSGDRAPAWSPDGSRIAFLRPKDKQSQVWIIPADGGEATVATALPEGVSTFQWSPDSKQLLLTAEQEADTTLHAELTSAAKQASNENDDPMKNNQHEPAQQAESSSKQENDGDKLEALVIDRITYKSDSGGLWNGRRQHLYVHSLDTGKGQWITSGAYDVHAAVWSPDGQQIAFAAHMPSEQEIDPDFALTNDVYTIAVDGSDLQRWTNDEYGVASLQWSPDGSQIAFIASDESYHNATLLRLYGLSLHDGSISCLCDDSELMIANVLVGDTGIGANARPVYSKDSKHIYVHGSAEGAVRLLQLEADGSGHTVLLDGARNIHYFAPLHNGTFAIVSSSPLQPGELFVADPATGTEMPLTHANDELLDSLLLSTPQELQVTSVDGHPLQAWLMPPVGVDYDADHKVPTVLEIHGGPHMMYGFTFVLEFQLLCSQGYAVLFTNPRGSHGYGQKFVNACRGDYGGSDYRDLMTVTDYVLEHIDWIDPQRLGVTGGSYGGFMTNWIVGQTDRFKAAVTQRSISNWISFYGVSDIGFYFTEDQIGGNPWDKLEQLWKHSPLAYAGNVKTPILILHGEKDLRCPIEQAEQWFTALKRLGVTTRLVRFPEANHELSRSGHPQLRIQRLEQITGWFEQYLR